MKQRPNPFGSLFRSLMTKAAILSVVIVIIFGLFCGGCAIGPKFLHTEQKDSAIIEGPRGAADLPYLGSSTVTISKIDGVDLGFFNAFEASSPGLLSCWMGYFLKPLSIVPGKHVLVMDFQKIENDPASPGGSYLYTGSGTIKAEFAANHIYRITATGCFSVTLWDETGGLSTRSIVKTWGFDGQQSYIPADKPPSHFNADAKKKQQ
jgi:hypothetical protein